MRCADCPVPEGSPCLGDVNPRFAQLCQLAASGDPIQRRHVVNRSAIGAEPPPPGFLERAVTFAEAMIQHAAAGFPKADEETVKGRLEICRACEFFDPESEHCRRCGCNMPYKVTMADMSCPLDPPKWGPVTSPASVPASLHSTGY
jgi:hypothetical protein